MHLESRLRYRPWCPKCQDTLYLDDIQHPPVVACRCGFRIVDGNQISNFVHCQRREFDAKLEALRKVQAERLEALRLAKAAKARRARDRSRALRVVPDPPPVVPKPTKSQIRRAATTPVTCSVCGVTLFRRKKDAERGGPFFCGREHRVQWAKEHPIRQCAG